MFIRQGCILVFIFSMIVQSRAQRMFILCHMSLAIGNFFYITVLGGNFNTNGGSDSSAEVCNHTKEKVPIHIL
jgi:hypothetical protein